jgi:hypothetical protein
MDGTKFDAARDLAFGHKWDDVPAVKAAWGARLIFPNDVVWDRTDAAGDDTAKAALLDYLRTTVGTKPFDTAYDLRYTMKMDADRAFTLYEDDTAKVVGHPHGNSGYLYVTAWLKAHEEVV